MWYPVNSWLSDKTAYDPPERSSDIGNKKGDALCISSADIDNRFL